MKIETKFNVGDEIIFICNNKIKTGHIDGIKVMASKNKTAIHYYVYGAPMDENELFCNKEELFNALEQQLSNAKL